MSIEQVNVPDIGGAEGAEVIELLVQVGDDVQVDEGLVLLESDKASMEIPSTVAGKVVEMLVSEGDELVEGSPVAKIEVAGDSGDVEEQDDAEAAEGEDGEEPASAKAPEQDSEEDAEEKAAGDERRGEGAPERGEESGGERSDSSRSEGDRKTGTATEDEARADTGETGDTSRDDEEEQTKARAGGSEEADAKRKDEDTAADKAAPREKVKGESPPEKQQQEATTVTAPAEVHAGPAVRKLARELGVPLAQVSGSGPQGRVLKEDLQEFVRQRFEGASASGGVIPEVPEQDFGEFGDIEVSQRSRLDKLTAANMHRSWLNVPHVTQFDAADITELEAFRRELKAEAEERGTKLSPLPFVLKACAVALQDNPRLNSSLAAGGEQLVSKNYCHIGMAVDTPVGLMVPVIRDVDRKSVWELAEEVVALATKARDRKLKPAEMQGGTFTVSSLGRIGGMGFTPVINTPEVGILGVSRAEVRPVWDGNQFAPRTLLPLALSYDHRVVNGGDGGRFLTRVVTLLGDIRRLLM